MTAIEIPQPLKAPATINRLNSDRDRNPSSIVKSKREPSCSALYQKANYELSYSRFYMKLDEFGPSQPLNTPLKRRARWVM